MKKRKYEQAAETLKALGLPQSTISQHLRILRERKIIRARKDGTRRCYSVVDERAKSIARALC